MGLQYSPLLFPDKFQHNASLGAVNDGKENKAIEGENCGKASVRYCESLIIILVHIYL